MPRPLASRAGRIYISFFLSYQSGGNLLEAVLQIWYNMQLKISLEVKHAYLHLTGMETEATQQCK